jgi:hypothetical protein
VPSPKPADFKSPEYCVNPLAHSANNGAITPEVVRADVQSHDHYFLTINHASGVNQGYTVKVISKYVPYTPPHEAPEVTFDSSAPFTGQTTSGSASSGTGRIGGGGGGASLSPVASVPGATSLSPFAGIPGADQDLTQLTGSDLGSLINGRIAPRRDTGPPAPPKPVSGATVAIWLFLVPAVVLGGAAVWFARHRPAALRVRVPAAAT